MPSLQEGFNVIAHTSTQIAMVQNKLWFHGCELKLSGKVCKTFFSSEHGSGKNLNVPVK